VAGASLLGLGVALVLGGVVANAAVALPWGTLLSRPTVWVGAAVAAMGAILNQHDASAHPGPGWRCVKTLRGEPSTWNSPALRRTRRH
jgi:hypothetical protein